MCAQTKTLRLLTTITLTTLMSLVSVGFIPIPDHDEEQLSEQPLESVYLTVKPLQQRKITSCGEAAITMAYNYAYPETPLQELDVIAFAMQNDYYIDNLFPYTSPENMIYIARHYTENVEAGRVTSQTQGLRLLVEKLQQGQPVIIDSLKHLNNRYSGAHFVVVTGVLIDEKQNGAATIYYNDPLTARNESAHWDGRFGVWNAWQNNGDPGGDGWWMTIY